MSVLRTSQRVTLGFFLDCEKKYVTEMLDKLKTFDKF